MPVTAVKTYQTTDGKLHPTYEAAREHEAKFHRDERAKKSHRKHMEKIYKIFEKSTTVSGAISNVAMDLMNKPAMTKELRDALNGVLDYQRRKAKA